MPQFDAYLNGKTDLAAAPATGDYVPVVDVSDTTEDAGGTLKRVSVENLLASGTSTALWMGAADLEIASGTPALSAATGNWLSWLMDAASIEGIGSNRHLPDGWATYDVELWWVNGGAGSGDVSWRFDVSFVGAGDTLAAPAPGSVVTDTAGAQNVVVTTTLASGLTATTSELLGFRMFRIANGGGDTLANDAGVLGLLLTKAS